MSRHISDCLDVLPSFHHAQKATNNCSPLAQEKLFYVVGLSDGRHVFSFLTLTNGSRSACTQDPRCFC